MRIAFFCLASLFTAGCYLTHERLAEAPLEEPPPFVPCDGFYRVEVDSVEPVGGIDISFSVGAEDGGLYEYVDSCGFVAIDGFIYTAECGTTVLPGEALIAQVTLYFVTLPGLVPIELCHTDVEAEELLGMVRVTCGSEELPFERYYRPDMPSECVYLVR